MAVESVSQKIAEYQPELVAQQVLGQCTLFPPSWEIWKFIFKKMNPAQGRTPRIGLNPTFSWEELPGELRQESVWVVQQGMLHLPEDVISPFLKGLSNAVNTFYVDLVS